MHLQPENKIFKILRRVLDGRMQDLTVVLRTDGESLENQNIIKELATIIENAIYEITEIMVGPSIVNARNLFIVNIHVGSHALAVQVIGYTRGSAALL